MTAPQDPPFTGRDDRPGRTRTPALDPHLAVWAEEPRELIAGNAVRLLRNGSEAFPVWLAAIERAKARVSFEMYIFSDDVIGRRFAEALARAARRGVEVRVLYDYVGCRLTPREFFDRMREAGVQVRVYHGHRGWRPRFWRLFRRNHRKTIVVDGQVAYTGGLNISAEWLPDSEGGDDWRDAAIEIRGPAVPDIEAAFLRTWNRRVKKRARLDPASLQRPGVLGPTPLAVISNSERGERFAIRRATLFAINASTQRVFIANPYFVPDGGILRALRHAAARGVDVRVLLPRESDAPILDAAARGCFSRLLGAGVRVWESPFVVHTKVVLADDAFVSIGSYNLDHRSLAYNLELVVTPLDRDFATAAAAMIEDELSIAYAVDAQEFARRPLFMKAWQRFARGLRKWL